MTRDEFWEVIARARVKSADRRGRLCDALRAELEGRWHTDVRDFAAIFEELHQEADTWDLRAVAYILRGDANDDDFEAFRSWLISRGREAYESAVSDAHAVAQMDVGPSPEEDCFFAEFSRVPADVYEEMTGEAIPRTFDFLPIDPSGRPWEKHELAHRYPAIWSRFGS